MVAIALSFKLIIKYSDSVPTQGKQHCISDSTTRLNHNLKMREAIVHATPELHTTIHEVPIPDPGPDELLIKVIVAGSNPKGLSHSQLTSAYRLTCTQIGATSQQ
jgi:hypothetical protein